MNELNGISVEPRSAVDIQTLQARRGVRAAEGAGFENQCAVFRTAGSNPALSVIFAGKFLKLFIDRLLGYLYICVSVSLCIART